MHLRWEFSLFGWGLLPTPGPDGLHPARLGARPHVPSGWHRFGPSGFLFSPVSGSLKSGKVIVLSCRLSAMVLSKRLLPRPESLQNTATNVSHLKGGQGKETESTNPDSWNAAKPSVHFLSFFSTFPLITGHPASLPGLGWDSFQDPYHKHGLNRTQRPKLIFVSFVSL